MASLVCHSESALRVSGNKQNGFAFGRNFGCDPVVRFLANRRMAAAFYAGMGMTIAILPLWPDPKSRSLES